MKERIESFLHFLWKEIRRRDSMNYLAIDVGGTFIKYAVINDQGDILFKDKVPTKTDTLEKFLNSLVEIYEAVKEKENIVGIALSMPGRIDGDTGFMYTGGNIRCITNINIAELLEARCNTVVTVENDAKAAVLAELWNGSLENCKNAIVMVCGTGIGGAVIQDGKVVRGKHFMAGEFSYAMVDGKSDYHLDNTFAANAGINALLRYVSEETGISADELNGEKIFEIANAGEEKAIKGLNRFVHQLAVQINNYHYILDPEIIAIGGGISVQPLFIEMVREELKKINEAYPWDLPVPEVTTCKYFNDANLIGAVYAHLKKREDKNL